MQVHCPNHRDNGHAEMTSVDHVKLFRNRPDLRFEGRIHEQIIPPIRRAGGDVKWTDIFVVHSGADHSPEGRRGKLERDYRLLHLDLKDRPNHPFVLFNLGMTYADDLKWGTAVTYLTRSIEVSHPSESHLRKAYALLASGLSELRRIGEAIAVCETAQQLFPRDPELMFRRAMLHHDAGHLAEARTGYEELLSTPREQYYSSIDLGITGYKARQNLAVILAETGDHASAAIQWRHILQEMPEYAPAWKGLGDTLIEMGQDLEFEELCCEAATHSELTALVSVLRARKCLAASDVNAARASLEEAINANDDDIDAHQELCRLLFEQQDLPAAQARLKHLAEKQPADGAVHHNLASVHAQLGEFDDAVAAFQQSLLVRPDSSQTWVELCRILNIAGRSEEAARAESDPEKYIQTIQERIRTS